jgi:hypothetical protein
MRLLISLLFIIKILFLAGCHFQQQNPDAKNSPMDFRSIAFHVEGDSGMIKRAAELGFNNVTLHNEGSTLRGLHRIREMEEKKGYLSWARSLGMTTAVWMREISDFDGDPSELTLDNEDYWQSIRDKYDHYFKDLVPEVDYIFFTVVESQLSLADSDLLVKMVETVNEKCREHGKTLILRTFVHEREEMDILSQKVQQLPDDVMLMIKNVEQDWRMRGPDHQLIGKIGDKKQIIEVDASNEYHRVTYLPNCYTDNYHKRFRYWQENGITGIEVRVSRSPRDGAWWEPLAFRHLIYGEPNEVVLWALGYLASGKSDSIDRPWKDFCQHYFGSGIAHEMEQILRPQGEISAEAFNVMEEPYGMARIHIPDEWTMNGEHCKCGDTIAVKYPDEDDMLYRNPFHMKHSVHRWHPLFKEQYHKIRRGHPDIVKAKSDSANYFIALSDSLLERFYKLENQMDVKTYNYYKFKLEENNWLLKVKTHWMLAWLKASQILYLEDFQINTSPEEHKEELTREIFEHLDQLKALEQETNQSLEMNWYGKNIKVQRGEYLDIHGFIDMFSRYWQLNYN